MDAPELGLSIVDLIQEGFKRKGGKKRITNFVRYLAGGDSPIEAMELTLRRSGKLREAEWRNLADIVKIVEKPKDGEKYEDVVGKAIFQLLFDCNVLTLVLRLLKVQLPSDTMVTCDVPWTAVHYNSLVIIKHLVDLSDNTVSHIKDMVKNDTVEALLEYCGEELDIVACYPAMYALKELCLGNLEACERMIFSNGLPKLGHMLMKDNCQKMAMKTYNTGLSPYQIQIMQTYFMQNFCLFKTRPFKHDADVALKVVISWSFSMQMYSAMILIKIAGQNDRHRKMMMDSTMVCKALMKWLKSPGITSNDCEIIDASMRILALISLNEELAWKLIDEYRVCSYLEVRITTPQQDTATSSLEIIRRMSAHSGRCRDKIIENQNILKTLSMYVFSFHKQIQEITLRILDNLVDTNEHAKQLLTHGITPKTITLLGSYYEHHAGQHAQSLKKCFNKICSRDWKQEEAVFSNVRGDFLAALNIKKSKELKDRGNQKFKENLFDEAVQLYSEALELTPPALKPSDAKQGSLWYVLPAVLYSNRAQCHLKTENWAAAVQDCSNAVARSYEENEEADKILQKTAYRRAKALLEVGSYRRALTDIAFCLRHDYSDSNIKTLYWEIIAKYRNEFGPEPIRRCGLCLGGEGEKLKRCGNCVEVYCSRKCQADAWELGHKNFCSGKI